MTWRVVFIDEAKKDLKRLDHSVQIQVIKGISKVSQNPVSVYEGGCGKPLGNKGGVNLTNLFKIKYRDLGIRVVYKVEYTDTAMKIIIISARSVIIHQVQVAFRCQHGTVDLGFFFRICSMTMVPVNIMVPQEMAPYITDTDQRTSFERNAMHDRGFRYYPLDFIDESIMT